MCELALKTLTHNGEGRECLACLNRPRARNGFECVLEDRLYCIEKGYDSIFLQLWANLYLVVNISDIREFYSTILSTTTQVSFNLITFALVLLAIGTGFCLVKRWMKPHNHPLHYLPVIPIADLPTVRGTL